MMNQSTLYVFLGISGFVLMFKQNELGLSFHEIGGVAVCLIFIAHKLLNKGWIIAVRKNLFARS